MKGKPLTIAISAVCLLTAFAVGWNIPDSPATNPTGTSVPTRGENTLPSRDTGRRTAKETEPQKAMRSIRDAGSPEEKLRATISFANTLPPSDFADWAEGDLFTYRSGPELFIFRMILFERWIAEDPESLIAWTAKNNYGQAHRGVDDIADNNPEILIDYYRKNPDPRAELRNLSQVATKHPDMALARLLELSESGVTGPFPSSSQGAFREIAKTSLAALQASLDSFDPVMRKEAETAIAGQLLRNSFPEGMRSLSDNPDGFSIFTQSVRADSNLQTNLLDNLDGLSDLWREKLTQQSYYFVTRENARDWIEADLADKGFSGKQQNQIEQRALGNLVRQDPQFVIQQIDNFELPASVRSQLISVAISSVKDNPDRAEAIISGLSSEEDRGLARGQLELFELQAKMTFDTDSMDWLTTLGNLDPKAPNSSDLLWTLRDFDTDSLAKVSKTFEKLQPAEKQNIARIVSAGVGRYGDAGTSFFGDAVRYYVENTSAEDANRVTETPEFTASTFAVGLVKKDPAKATQWVATLPDGESKLWAQKNVARNWAQYDPKAVNQWIRTLPASQRSEILDFLDQ